MTNTFDETRIHSIVHRVLSEMGQTMAAGASSVPASKDVGLLKGEGIFPDMESAIVAAVHAQEELVALKLENRERIIAAMRAVSLQHASELAELAWRETRRGAAAARLHR